MTASGRRIEREQERDRWKDRQLDGEGEGAGETQRERERLNPRPAHQSDDSRLQIGKMRLHDKPTCG